MAGSLHWVGVQAELDQLAAAHAEGEALAARLTALGERWLAGLETRDGHLPFGSIASDDPLSPGENP